MLRTLEELRSVIGRNIEDLQRKDATDHEREVMVERATYTASLAKQFNNSAKIVLNADQMENRSDRIDDWIGEKHE